MPWPPRVRTLEEAMLDYAAEDVEVAIENGGDFEVVPPCSESDECKDERPHPAVSC
jgi:hypothetical protein